MPLSMPMFTSHTLSTALFALIYARNVSARRGGGSGAEVSIHAPIDSMTAAIFAFNIIFAIFTFLQALKALGGLGKRRPGEDFPRRKPFTMILLLGILAQGTAYTLGAVYKMSLPTGSYWQKYTCALGHVFLYAGLLLLVDYRSKIQALQYGHKRSKPFVVALRSVSSVLLLLMFICLLLRSLLNFRNFGNPYYIFLASYIITTIVICGASITLWTNRRPLESQYDLLMYDAHVFCRIVKIICPILAIRALYELIVEVIILGDININSQGLTLADVLIQGLSYLVVFNVALALGLLPKSDEQDSEQHSAQED